MLKNTNMRVCKLLYGINTIGLNNILQDVSYLKDKKIKEKYKKYKKFLELKNETSLSLKRIKCLTEMSKSEFYRINKFLRNHSWANMERKSTRPKKFRQTAFSSEIRGKILKIRQENPTYGKDKIHAILIRDFKDLKNISASSVGRILKKFKEQGKITRSISAICKKKKRRFTGYAKKWEFGKNIPKNIGEMIQIDHMSVTKNQRNYKHFAAICPTSKIILADVYTNATSFSARSFLQNCIKKMPFKIKSIQVDGGSEFMKYFEEECSHQSIPLYVLPPASPKYNGNVERSNRIFREEFYARKDVLANNIDEMRLDLQQSVKKYNEYRPHNNLKFKTPMEYYYNVMNEGNFSQML
jgi:putative transposase